MVSKKAKTIKLPVIIKPGEDGYFVAEIPVLPGCLSQGKTREEALANIKDAAQLYLETVGKKDVLTDYTMAELKVTV